MLRTTLTGCLFLAAATPAWAQAWDATDFNAAARARQPPPVGHVPGKDSGAGAGRHNAGEDCGTCHTPGGKAGDLVFTIAGTIYEDRAARRPAGGVEVVLQGADGRVLSMVTNELGNFWTLAPVGSNPWAVSSHGATTDVLFEADGGVLARPADPADSRTWQYKAWLRSGDTYRTMVTIAPVGGASAATARMSCNMHHAPMGASGAAWVSRRPTLAAYPVGSISFRKHVLPVLTNKCVPCHLPGPRRTRVATASDLRAQEPTTVDYSGGRDFTSYGGSTVGGVTKGGFRSVVDPASPEASLALLKTRLGGEGVVHAGGSFWDDADPDYRALRAWIEEGALDN